jgi:hypothetical protein
MIRYFTTHPTAANILMAVFLVLGVVALPSLLRETFPRMEPRTVQITVANPGATSGEVARSICRPIEEALEGIENLDEVVCVARESLALRRWRCGKVPVLISSSPMLRRPSTRSRTFPNRPKPRFSNSSAGWIPSPRWR